MENKEQPEIEDYGITVEEYLEGMAKGIDVLELERLKRRGLSEDFALEVMQITDRVVAGTATLDEVVRGLVILTPSLHDKLDQTKPVKLD